MSVSCYNIQRSLILFPWNYLLFSLFLAATISPILCHVFSPTLFGERELQYFNIISSIGSGGVASFIFYFFVNRRLERKWSSVVRDEVRNSYLDAKRNIVIAVIHASIKGGRADISAETDTIDFILSGGGNFKEIFPWKGEADEGFSAFQNQMSNQTPEYREIIFNLKSISRAFDRLIDSGYIGKHEVYKRAISLNEIIFRIESDGAGYDESRGLCHFIWTMFALESDPIEEIISKS